jgi:hypothetical protein
LRVNFEENILVGGYRGYGGENLQKIEEHENEKKNG